MDLLESLNVDDLPEQQTRTIRHLLQEDHADADTDDFDPRFGFDCCCTCGKKKPTLDCPSCHRVKYCSKKCMEKDSSPSIIGEEEEHAALGHSSIICSLLNLCNDDEVMEGGDNAEIALLDRVRRATATDRLASEFESYAATLSNVLMEGPPYQDALSKSASQGLTIHVIGASEDSELWKGHPDSTQEKNAFEGYADALAEIAESYSLPWIRLHFFGPELPAKAIRVNVPIPPVQAKKSSAKLSVKTFRKDYHHVSPDSNAVTALPDIAVFFNPGFTCTHYDWEPSLSFLKSNSIPFLVATNTEMESMADIQYLVERQVFQDIPVGLRSVLTNGEEEVEEEDDAVDSLSFFSVNPYAGLRVRQSATMANDLYVKSRWIFGGISSTKPAATGKRKGPRTAVEDENDRKKIRTKGSGNSKKSNPALI